MNFCADSIRPGLAGNGEFYGLLGSRLATAGLVIAMKQRDVRALGNLNHQAIAALVLIERLKLLAQPRRAHAYDRIGLRIVARLPVEDRDANGRFLQIVMVVTTRLLHTKSQQSN